MRYAAALLVLVSTAFTAVPPFGDDLHADNARLEEIAGIIDEGWWTAAEKELRDIVGGNSSSVNFRRTTWKGYNFKLCI